MGFASFTVLVWDHVDTFAEEVIIWMGEKGPSECLVCTVGILFLINRYLTPLGFIVNLCDRFIRFEGSMTVIGINIVAIMMYLRIRALYHGNCWVLGGVLLLLLAQICMNAWLMTRSQRTSSTPSSSCTMIFDPSISAIASSSAWLPLLYDTAVYGLTVAIFAVTLVLTLMIISAPEGLKNITAQLTVAMMSRITINLKKSARKINGTQIRPEMPSNFTQKSQLDVVPDIDIRIAAPGFVNYGTQSEGEFLPMERIARESGEEVSRRGGKEGLVRIIPLESPLLI
ncbi:hypothetical protein DFP72DRAFT_990020 [Ephemerocybe angulata]|uniref:DUF6533 domain-containing protein n=1 Tax=Ephemerocybe angulata TaxID=980116 RepID=A0A8H6HZA9_9AGAR|nr:hypothetical protein DFP72DRAFT_990020 [Tulosesus angulatus]